MREYEKVISTNYIKKEVDRCPKALCLKCLLLIVFVVVLACGCKDKRQRAIELNEEGWKLMGTWMPDSLEMALAFFDKAIDVDSTYSVAYVNKVQCLNSLNRRAEIMSTMERLIGMLTAKNIRCRLCFLSVRIRHTGRQCEG